MTRSPAISAVLPVFNAEAYVREAVESILQQTFTDFELIIINDGSTDGSAAILRELAARDPRIVLVERVNDGLVSALNEGIARARADLIARMDADDVAAPERFALQYARMKAAPELGVLGSFIQLMDKTGSAIRLGTYPVTSMETARFLEEGCPLAHPTVMMRREAVLKAGGYRRIFSHCEDYDLWLRISELGFAIANVPKPLLNYRIHGSNVSAVHRQAQELGTIVALLCHRARQAGLPDPSAGVDVVHEGLIEAIPFHLREDLQASFFVTRHARISIASLAEIKSAWKDFSEFDKNIRLKPVMSDFLLRISNGAIRERSFILAIRVIFMAIRLQPSRTILSVWRKIKPR